MKTPPLKYLVALLAMALAQEALAVEFDMAAPKKGRKYIRGCVNIGCIGTAAAGDTIIVELVSGGVVQARDTVTANATATWGANLKRPPAGWFLGEAVVTARIGKRQVSTKITFVPD